MVTFQKTYFRLKSRGGAATAAVTDTVGPSTKPSLGEISNTEGSSTSGAASLNPRTRMAVERRQDPSPGTCATVQRAGTLVGLVSSRMPSQVCVVRHTPKYMRGLEAARNGVLILVTIGTCRLWPVAYEKISLPRCSVGAPASLLNVFSSFSRRSRFGLNAMWNDPDSYNNNVKSIIN